MFSKIRQLLGIEEKKQGDTDVLEKPVEVAPKAEEQKVEEKKVVLYGDSGIPESQILEKEADQELYDFKTLSMEEMKNYPDAIHDMYVGKIDGFLIKNFMSPEEVDKLLKKLYEIRDSDQNLSKLDTGFTYPTVFAEFSRRLEMADPTQKAAETSKYFLASEEYNQTSAQVYGVDTLKKITDFFTTLGGGRKVEVPRGVNEEGQYPFTTFRYLVPYQGLMTVHCGNYFGKTFEQFYAHMNTKVATKNQMSFFVMLHEPEEGGELSLFNFRWKEGQTKTSPNEDNEVIEPDGTKRYVQTDPSIRKNKLRPKKGDMILFQGGNIWHRVERVKGKEPRITYGGFLSLNYAGDTIYYWS